MVAAPTQDRQIYIVPVSARAAKARADRAAIRGVETRAITEKLKAEGAELPKLPRGSKDKLHLWAIRSTPQFRGTWGRIEPGDWFLFVSRGFIFGCARVFGRFESRPLATALWGAADGSEFRLLILFDEVRQLDVPAWDFRPVLGGRFIGFRRLGDDLRGTMVRKYGSVDEFVTDELTRADEERRADAT